MTLAAMTNEQATNAAAAAAATSWFWLPWLQSVSEIAALLLPIAGVTWLVVQIVLKVRNHHNRRP